MTTPSLPTRLLCGIGIALLSVPLIAQEVPPGELPAAVQEAIRRHANGRPVGEVDRETWEGRTVYEVEFQQEGSSSRVHVEEDGTIVQDKRASLSAQLKDFFLGTQLTDTPAPVQQTIRREASGRRINDIDIERRSGDTVYEVEIQNAESGVFQLHIDRTGRVIRDSRANAPQPNP